MKHVLIAPVLVLSLAHAAPAQSDEDGFSLMEEGAKLFFRGIMREVEPTLNDLEKLMEEAGPAMRSFLDEMGPALDGILDNVEDWTLYELPEMLPNGDIIIRRKPGTLPEIDI